jgi:hypothetical protein
MKMSDNARRISPRDRTGHNSKVARRRPDQDKLSPDDPTKMHGRELPPPSGELLSLFQPHAQS